MTDERFVVIEIMNYWIHLKANWRVAGHAIGDCLAHLIHGLIPAIKISHHQPDKAGELKEGKA